MIDEEKFISEKFVIIDGIHFVIDYYYTKEYDRTFLNGFHEVLNGTLNGLSARFNVIVQTEEQHDLISDYIWRMNERKERKIKCFHRSKCFKYDIKKLKFDGMKIKDNLDIAQFHTESANRSYSPYKNKYGKEDIDIFKRLDEAAKNLKMSASTVSKFKL